MATIKKNNFFLLLHGKQQIPPDFCYQRIKAKYSLLSIQHSFVVKYMITLQSCVLFCPTEVPHEFAESLAPTAKERAKEQRKPKRRMGAPG
jgi:hypothetical protein